MNNTQQTNEPIKLSPRLQAVAAFVRPGSRAADVGTDHGYIPMYLLQAGICPRVLAMDVRKGPLERAAAHRAYLPPDLQQAMEIRLGDGLQGMQEGEADTVIIAGMGGNLIIRILEESQRLWDSVSHWILSPQSDLERVRHFLEDHGFAIEDEDMVEDEGKYYTILSVVRGTMQGGREADYLYGRCLIQRRHPVLLQYLEKEERRLDQVIAQLQEKESETENARQAMERALARRSIVREVRNEMQ